MVQKGPTTDDGNARSAADDGVQRSAFNAVQYTYSAVVGAWMSTVHVFSWIAARAVATVLFVAVFVPYSLVMRLVAFDPLDRDVEPATESYWTGTEATNTEPEEFRRLY